MRILGLVILKVLLFVIIFGVSACGHGDNTLAEFEKTLDKRAERYANNNSKPSLQPLLQLAVVKQGVIIDRALNDDTLQASAAPNLFNLGASAQSNQVKQSSDRKQINIEPHDLNLVGTLQVQDQHWALLLGPNQHVHRVVAGDSAGEKPYVVSRVTSNTVEWEPALSDLNQFVLLDRQ